MTKTAAGAHLFVLVLAVLFGFLGCSESSDAHPPSRVASKPNVLVVLLDDLGYSDLGSYGGEIRTPNMDQLADVGTRFRNFYVTPRCSSTRMSLLTGQYTQQVATEPGASLPPLRSDNNVTLAEVLSSAGYRTYMAQVAFGPEARSSAAAARF